MHKEKALGNLVLILGVMLVGYGIWRFIWAYQGVIWPKTSGVVNYLWFEANTSLVLGREPYLVEDYSPIVEYEYQVGDTTYQGRFIGMEQWTFRDVEAAQQSLVPYRKGEGVTVHYHPRKPHLSVLGFSNSPRDYGLFLIGISLLMARVIFGGVEDTSSDFYFSRFHCKLPKIGPTTTDEHGLEEDLG